MGRKKTNPNTRKQKTVQQIGSKDTKLLWSRAAGICSFPGCREQLTMEIDKGGSTTLGEMCHIVGEKPGAARGKSNLSLKDRNQYSNLILLCRHHHIQIDRFEAKYTIELLHKIKSDHEIWVTESLSAKKLSPADLVYSSLIDQLTVSLYFDQWNWFIDNAVRQIIHEDIIMASDTILERQLSTVWLGQNIGLEQAAKNLMATYLEYINQFMVSATLPHGGNFFSADLSYKQPFPNPDYHFFSDSNDLWARKNFLMLCKYIVSVNEFASEVRKYSNPYYYIERGRFLILDTFGTHLGNPATFLDPTASDVQKWITKLNVEIDAFKVKHSGREFKI